MFKLCDHYCANLRPTFPYTMAIFLVEDESYTYSLNYSWPPGCTVAPCYYAADKVQTWSFLLLIVCFPPQMVSSALVMFLVLHFEFGQSSHKHQDDDHYIGQQHNPEHDMNILLGDEVSKT